MTRTLHYMEYMENSPLWDQVLEKWLNLKWSEWSPTMILSVWSHLLVTPLCFPASRVITAGYSMRRVRCQLLRHSIRVANCPPFWGTVPNLETKRGVPHWTDEGHTLSLICNPRSPSIGEILGEENHSRVQVRHAPPSQQRSMSQLTQSQNNQIEQGTQLY